LLNIVIPFLTVFVYTQDNLNTPIGTHIVDFGNIAAGAQPLTRDIGRMNEFVWLKTEEIAVVVGDRWQYTPQNNQVVLQSEVPQASQLRFQTTLINMCNSTLK
jgi:hypothetical protein